jgi:hypothetical protein
MKQPFGAKLPESYARSTLWIAVNLKKEDAATVSMSAQNCQPSGATISDFPAKQYCRLEIGFVYALASEPRETEVNCAPECEPES